MSRTLNKVMLIGNVGKEPEMKHTPGGIPVVTFTLATTETWKDRGGNDQEHTDWHTIVAWRGLAEICYKIVHKGARIYVEGRLQCRDFEDKSGTHRHYVEVLIDNMLMLDPKKENGKNITSESVDFSGIEYDNDFLSSIIDDTYFED